MKRTAAILAGICFSALAAAAPPVFAQPAQRSDDCRSPVGCGTLGKPGGVERAPSSDAVEVRGARKAAPSERRGVIDDKPSYCDVEPPCPKGCREDTANRICVDEPSR